VLLLTLPSMLLAAGPAMQRLLRRLADWSNLLQSVLHKMLAMQQRLQSSLSQCLHCDLMLMHLQVDGEPDQPDVEELEAMQEKQEAAYTQAHSNFSAMVIGANSKSFLQRGGIFDVMNNKTGGIAKSGDHTCTRTYCTTAQIVEAAVRFSGCL
jgi:hypothetical protein